MPSTEPGLFIGARTCLARLTRSGRLALEADGVRLVTRLSVADG